MAERRAIDRSEVVFECYPGATNDLDEYARLMGGWVCEQHPEMEWPHDDCAGPGMLRDEEQYD